MFTGIVEEIVEAGVGVLRLRAPKVLSDARLGDSIEINGVDLAIAEILGDTLVTL
jgi:riboflavin synthase alpha subunit